MPRAPDEPMLNMGRTRAVQRALAWVAVAALAGALGGFVGPSADAAADDPSLATTVDLIHMKGLIDPPSADYLRARLQAAQEDGVAAAVIQLDTPGGLEISMRSIVQEILASDVPVVVWIAPGGARAASAGTFITYSAHLAFMAASTEIGAATPVNLGGDTPPALEAKVTNDAAAFLRELAITRNRNADFAERAVRAGAAVGATEAAATGVVDGVASSLRDLLQAMDSKTVALPNGTSATLDTWDEADARPAVTLRFQQMNLLQRALHAVTDPDVAFFLLLIGIFGIIFELYNPGIGLAGIIGVAALVMGFYAFSVLPTNWAGVLLIVAAIVFLLVDLHTGGLGLFSIAGLVGLAGGAMLLFSSADSPAVRVHPWSIVAGVGFTVVFFVSVMTAALRVRLRRPITGQEGIVGTVGVAKTDIAPEGTVLSKGTLWRARTMETGIAAGARVEIKAMEGLVLLVEPLHDDADEATEPAQEVKVPPRS